MPALTLTTATAEEERQSSQAGEGISCAWRQLTCPKCASEKAEKGLAADANGQQQRPMANGDQRESSGALLQQQAGDTTSGHCLECLLLHNEHLVDSMSVIICRLLNEGELFSLRSPTISN